MNSSCHKVIERIEHLYKYIYNSHTHIAGYAFFFSLSGSEYVMYAVGAKI